MLDFYAGITLIIVLLLVLAYMVTRSLFFYAYVNRNRRQSETLDYCYHCIDYCPHCGSPVNEVYSDHVDGVTSEAEVYCNECMRSSYWVYGSFNVDERDFKGRYYANDQGNLVVEPDYAFNARRRRSLSKKKS